MSIYLSSSVSFFNSILTLSALSNICDDVKETFEVKWHREMERGISCHRNRGALVFLLAESYFSEGLYVFWRKF